MAATANTAPPWLSFTVADVDAACDEVSSPAAAGSVQPPAVRAGEGIILAFLADTEGNGFRLVWALTQNNR